MLSQVKTSSIAGSDAVAVEVEVQVKNNGQGYFSIIGLGDSAVKESRERVVSAVQSAGFKIPNHVLVNLAPAELKKEGSSFDVAIAVALLAASGQLRNPDLHAIKFHGELALDGRIKAIRGALAYAIEAFQDGASQVIVPMENVSEAKLISEIDVIGVESLEELVCYLEEGVLPQQKYQTTALSYHNSKQEKRLSDVCGQRLAKRALLIAAAGGHNLLMIGPPGCGKSMLAERFSSLLPKLSKEEALAVAKIYSISRMSVVQALARQRPYRNPHHVVTEVGLVGGGTYPRPGELSLAHKGVLFLDEFPEFRRSAIEALRAPLESGEVHITRAKGKATYPADFQLIAAMNPCPCGRMGIKGSQCLCSRNSLFGYLKKLSQPILDRIDLHVELEAVSIAEIKAEPKKSAISDDALKEQVLAARDFQKHRFKKLNYQLEIKQLTKKAYVEDAALAYLEKSSSKMGLSARGYTRVLRVARTIADLKQVHKVEEKHIAEALDFRCLERLERYCKGDI